MKKQCIRCPWVVEENSLLLAYHDKEWGVPVHDDQKHFEMLILEGAQAGLSWNTILQRRKNYCKAFDHFDPNKIANYDAPKVVTLLENQGIIRNKLKIQSAIKNAQLFLKIQEEYGSFDDFVWSFVEGQPIQNQWQRMSEIPTETKESKVLSQALKKRGFTFVGSVIIYSYMQAVGLVNDHLKDCFRHKDLS